MILKLVLRIWYAGYLYNFLYLPGRGGHWHCQGIDPQWDAECDQKRSGTLVRTYNGKTRMILTIDYSIKW